MKNFNNKLYSICFFSIVLLFSSCGAYVVNYAYLDKEAKKNKNSKFENFVVFENKLKDTIEGTLEFKKDKIILNGNSFLLNTVDCFQNENGLNIRYYEGQDYKYSKFFVRIINGAFLSLYKGDLEKMSYSSTRNDYVRTSYTVLSVVSNNNLSYRTVLSPDLLKTIVEDDSETLLLAKKLFKWKSKQSTNDYKKVIQIVNMYNTNKLAGK